MVIILYESTALKKLKKIREIALLIVASCLFASCASLMSWFNEPAAAPPATPAPPAQTASVPEAGAGGEKQDALRSAVLAEAEKYIDAPYVSPPSVPRNFDCSGFVSYIFGKAAGLSLPTGSSAYANIGDPIRFEDARPGDLLVFTSSPGGSYVNHVAILYKKSASGELRGSYLIHAVSIPTKTSTIKGNPDTTGVKITEMGKRGDGNWKNEYFLSRVYSIRDVL
jgi:cell wall-associated NlpC family hydrolase